MQNDSVWVLIGDKLCGEASEQQLETLNRMAQTNESLRSYLQVIQIFWNAPPAKLNKEFENVFEKIAARLAVKDPCFFQYSGKKMN